MNTKSFWMPLFTKLIPADFETWAEQLALAGWNIGKLKTFSVFRLTFHKTEPKRFRYVYDLNIPAALKFNDYKQTYEQFGWEYVGCFNANTYLWRKEYTGERPESFTDIESILNRNKRVRNAVAVVFAFSILVFLAFLAGIIVGAVSRKIEIIPPLACGLALVSLEGAYLFWVIRKINASLDR